MKDYEVAVLRGGNGFDQMVVSCYRASCPGAELDTFTALRGVDLAVVISTVRASLRSSLLLCPGPGPARPSVQPQSPRPPPLSFRFGPPGGSGEHTNHPTVLDGFEADCGRLEPLESTNIGWKASPTKRYPDLQLLSTVEFEPAGDPS